MFMSSIQQTHEPGISNPVELIANKEYGYALFLFSSVVTMFCFWLLEGGTDRKDHAHPHPNVRHGAILHGFQAKINMFYGSDTDAEMEIARQSFIKIDRILNPLYPAMAGNFEAYRKYHSQGWDVDRNNELYAHLAYIQEELGKL